MFSLKTLIGGLESKHVKGQKLKIIDDPTILKLLPNTTEAIDSWFQKS